MTKLSELLKTFTKYQLGVKIQALKEYAQHKPHCDLVQKEDYFRAKCTCGLDKLKPEQ